MRAVSFVDRLELEFNGNLLQYALTVGDVDNDGDSELIVGNAAGDLVIFKGSETKPWRRGVELGMISAVAVGDIFNCGCNSLVVASGEGWCYVFDIDKTSDQEKSFDADSSYIIKPVHTQRIPPNVKQVLLGDVNGDGLIELVIALTDRVVRTYCWATHGDLTSSKPAYKLIGIDKWEFANQIGSVTINRSPDGSPSLLVGQPGGTMIRLKCQSIERRAEISQTEGQVISDKSVDFHPLASAHMSNPNISSEILGDFSQGSSTVSSDGSPYAVTTLDGTLMLVQNEKILWSIQVNRQLFALNKMDMTGDGRDEVIVCSWDGHTYIANQEKQSVRFQFEEPVCTFHAGYYAVEHGHNVPCLIYATFSNRIYVYYKVTLSNILAESYFEVMKSKEGVKEELERLSVDQSDHKQLKQLYEWVLYGIPQQEGRRLQS